MSTMSETDCLSNELLLGSSRRRLWACCISRIAFLLLCLDVKYGDISENCRDPFIGGQWNLGDTLRPCNGNIHDVSMDSFIVSPTMAAFSVRDLILFLDVTCGFTPLRTQHVATKLCLHRQIHEPLTLLSFLPLQMIEISDSPIHSPEFLWQQLDTSIYTSLHMMHPFVYVQAFWW